MDDRDADREFDPTTLAIQAGTPPPAHGDPAADHDRPSQSEAEAAVRTLIRWAGDDPGREGLADTPGRVVRSYREMFAGYGVA